jgi:HEAT repeat protein
MVVVALLLLPMLMAAAFLLGRHLHRRAALREDLSAVSRQHIDLFQGGQLNEDAVEAVKDRFRELLERGELSAVEASLRPGTQYVLQVRALAELGTDAAGQILERQLLRRLTDDQLEQAWYWIDLACGLRALNRPESLPPLLKCADAAAELPLGQFFAAETVCFLGFAGYVRKPDTPLGRAALRVLHRSLEGLRSGVQPQMIVECRLGEMLEGLWDDRPEQFDPLVVRVFHEALRWLRRGPSADKGDSSPDGYDGADHETFGWQVARLEALEPSLVEYLRDAPRHLRARLGRAADEQPGGGRDLRDCLLALNDLRADAADELVPLLERPDPPHAEIMTELLSWSRKPQVGPWLRLWAARYVPMDRRATARRRMTSPARPSVTAAVPYRAVLRALRGHGSPETESFLLLAARDWDPTYRAAAVSSLGWWEPMQRAEVLATLQESRRDPNPDVRHAARAALARLGERQALQWFRQSLSSDDGQRVHETIQVIAAEQIVMLWPDLDRLAEEDDADLSHHARESLERLSEELDRRYVR